ALFALMLVAVVVVVARTLFNSPLAAASEVLEVVMVATIFRGYPLITREGVHISTELLDSVMPDRLRRAQHVLAALLGAAVFAAITWRIGYLSIDGWAGSEVTGVLGIPVPWVYAFICALSAGTCLTFLMLVPQAFARGPFVHPTRPVEE